MSCVFILAPVVVASWPMLCGAVAAASGVLGFRAITAGEELTGTEKLETNLETSTTTEIALPGSEIVAETMARASSFSIQKDDITCTFTRRADGGCAVHVAGNNRTEQELQSIGQEVIGRVTQQYAYNRVMTQLKEQGFNVNNEEVANDQTIRIQVSKYV